MGSSGGIFGLLGAFLADAIFNFTSVSYPLYRVLTIVIFAVLWLASSLQEGTEGISHTSHLIGVVYGFFLGALYLPSLPYEWMESLAPVAGAALLSVSGCTACMVSGGCRGHPLVTCRM